MKAIEVSNLSVSSSPRHPDLTRLSVQVNYPGFLGSSEAIWFELPTSLAAGLCQAGDPWFVTMLPLAVTLRLPLVLGIPVDELLLDNAERLMSIWSRWYPGLSPVPVKAEVAAAVDSGSAWKTAQLFSGGVDSLYTLLTAGDLDDLPIDELLFIHGFDLPLERKRTSEMIFQNLDKVVAELGHCLIPITTNLRQTRFQEVNWTDVGYGCALAGAALTLGPRYRQVLTASGMHPGFESHSGSHLEIDPLFTTRATSFVHHGSQTERIRKLEYLSSHPIAFNNIRVCFSSRSGGNCGRCMKCLIVMSILEVIGQLENTSAFPGPALDLNRVRRVYLARGGVIWRLIQKHALENGRTDVAEAIEHAFARTARIDRWLLLGWVRRARERFGHDPLFRRVTRGPRRVLFAMGRWLNRLIP